MPYDPSSRTYTPPAVSGYFPSDLFNAGAQPSAYAQGQVKPRFNARVVDKLPEGNIIQWQVLYEDMRGGLNMTVGRFDEDFDRIASGDGDGRFFKTLVLPQLITNATTTDPTGNLVGLHGYNLPNDRLYLGIGSGSGTSLFVETSVTDPTVVVTDYNAGSSITHITGIVAGGATNAVRLLISRITDPPQLVTVSSVTSTVVTTGHASLDNSFGAIQTFINDDTILFYANNGIWTLDKTQAISTAPTAALSNVPNGGTALGLCKLAGTPMRAYWLWPYDNNASGALLLGSERPMRVVSTNLEGTDYQELPLGLRYVFAAVIVNGSMIVATDKERVVLYDGRSSVRDLRWVSDRTPNSLKVFECRGLGRNGNEVWVRVNHKASAAGSGSTTAWWEVYNVETNAWHQVSASHTYGSTGTYGSLPSGAGLPISDSTGFIHDYSDGSWRRMFVPLNGYNPFKLYRNTVGSGSTGNEYEATATGSLTECEFPGLEGAAKIVTRITMLGDVDAGGTAATAGYVTWAMGNMSVTFGTGLTNRPQVVDITDNADVFYRGQPTYTLGRTTASTRYTPNGLPVMFEGYAFVPNMEPPFGWLDVVQ